LRSVFATGLLALLGLAQPATAQAQAQGGTQPAVEKGPFKIVHVMSFDSPWRWTDGQFAGFKEGLGSDVRAEYRVLQMDVKRNSSREAKEQKGREAIALIDNWKPDLVYTSDDDAQEFVTRHYLNQKLPFVFSGVNKEPREHGMEGASNVTGVLEQEHFVESVKLLQVLSPNIRRVAVISDSGPQWPPVIARMRASMGRLPGVDLVVVDQVKTFEQFKEKLASYPSVADAVVQLGVFNLAGSDGKNVRYQDVQKWASQNGTLPDTSFWIDRVHFGVLASMTISEREQGLAAGRLARAILVEGKSPASLPIKPTVKGHPAINLARAKQLGMVIKSTVLLSSEVVTGYEWDKAQ
ncbi:ABC transporter substrate binding protein, partial [Accumulibacter sp.]|uniref:ABC transporter substrate-binding protein n=1 Tax=Accumulibacter sp. TaxID=2053492 RepID=UPI0028C44DB8